MKEAPIELPTGQRESQHLEFKDARALEDGAAIPREVAAMLNWQGGIIWIGVPEEGGIACRPVGIPDVESKREALLNRLIDGIEPGFKPGDVVVETIPVSSEESILRITVKGPTPDERRPPYAWLRKGMRGFAIRKDHRVVIMDRVQLVDAFQGAAIPDASGGYSEARDWLANTAKRVKKGFPKCSYIAATRERTKEQACPPTDDQELWWDTALKIERSPWNPRGSRSLLAASFAPSVDNDLLLAVPKYAEMQSEWRLEADPRGSLLAVFPTEWVIWTDPKTPEPDLQRQLSPYEIIGATVSFLELLKGWMSQLAASESETIWLQIGMQDPCPPALRRHSPASSEYLYWKSPDDLSRNSCIWSDGVRVRLGNQRLQSSHEMVARQVVERIYKSFGFKADDIPFEMKSSDEGIELP